MLDHASEHPNEAECTAASGHFNAQAVGQHPTVIDLHKSLWNLNGAIRSAKPHASYEQKRDVKNQFKAMVYAISMQMKDDLLAMMDDRLSAWNDPDAPDFGRQFLAAMQRVGCKIVLDESIPESSVAAYRSFSYAPHNFGFPNQIATRVDHVDDPDPYISSMAHEYIHAFQKHASPALRCSPWNPNTRVIVHPEEWIMLEALSERDAYTKQAYINSIMARSNPDIRARSKRNIVSVVDFENIRASSASLEDAMVASALASLQKPTDPNFPRGRTFVNNYHDVALNHYDNAMGKRKEHKETGHVFVRLELKDFWQVGNYGVGPNSFGQYTMEPLIEKRHPLFSDAREKLALICKENNIPPLSQCPTLSDYEESIAVTAANEASRKTASQSYTPRAF